MDIYTEQRVVISVFLFFLDVVEAIYRLTGLISVEEIIVAFFMGLAAGVMICAYISKNTTDDVKEAIVKISRITLVVCAGIFLYFCATGIFGT